MDLSIYDRREIFEKELLLITGEALQTNKNSKVVTIWVAKGTHNNGQLSSFATALSSIKAEFARRGITIYSVEVNNDTIRNKHWTPTAAVDQMMAADIHVMIGSFFVGLIGSDESWNISNIQSNIDRLQHHLGVPMGRYTFCPIIRRRKYDFYCLMGTSDLCVPTRVIPLVDGIIHIFSS